MRDARGYVDLAEAVNGTIPKPVSFDYIWGEAIALLDQFQPHVRLINLETSITQSDEFWHGKGINYRMHPANTPCLTSAQIDCCALANNHVLDWGYGGLLETLGSLRQATIQPTGAGVVRQAAEAPAIIEVPGQGRGVVFSFGSTTSGIPEMWAARGDRPGINLLPDFSDQTVQAIQAQVQAVKQPGDVVVASIHWGGNWGYAIDPGAIAFAHALIDRAGVDLIHGHSSHHVKALEVYRDKLILYGCGDLINDYEGISGYETYRDDLGILYFVCVDPQTGTLQDLQMVPTQIKRFQLHCAEQHDVQWLETRLDRECKRFGCRIKRQEKVLRAHW